MAMVAAAIKQWAQASEDTLQQLKDADEKPQAPKKKKAVPDKAKNTPKKKITSVEPPDTSQKMTAKCKAAEALDGATLEMTPNKWATDGTHEGWENGILAEPRKTSAKKTEPTTQSTSKAPPPKLLNCRETKRKPRGNLDRNRKNQTNCSTKKM